MPSAIGTDSTTLANTFAKGFDDDVKTAKEVGKDLQAAENNYTKLLKSNASPSELKAAEIEYQAAQLRDTSFMTFMRNKFQRMRDAISNLAIR